MDSKQIQQATCPGPEAKTAHQVVNMSSISNGKRFFKISEASEYSGHSRSSLYDAHKRGELVFTKFGGSTRIEKADLDEFLDLTGVKLEVT